MARYIDADKLVEMYERSVAEEWNKKTAPSSWADAYDCVIEDIYDQPPADVVPKSEVEKILEEIERNIINSNFEFMFVNKKYFAELKKKYTE